ncbi:MAG: hypothetical protein HGA19_18040 [Oscillochloris sp.]|nr:hypothetical protein [Oscillochloris sp.]
MHQQIPLSAAMQIRVGSYGSNGLTLAPRHGTVITRPPSSPVA